MDSNADSLFKYEVVHVNIRGAVANKENLLNYISNNDFPEVITLNETKLGSETRFYLEGYKCAARKESGIRGGARGSMILVREDLQDVVEIEDARRLFANDELLGIEIQGKGDRPSLRIFTYYNPPSTNANGNVINFVDAQQGNAVLTGDLNCKNLCWGSSKTDKFGEELQEAINRSCLFVCNDGSPTRCDPFSGKDEVLDLVMHNFGAANLFQNFAVGECIGSDHYPIHAVYQFKPKGPLVAAKERRIEKNDWSVFTSELESFVSRFTAGALLKREEIDEAVKTISDKILSSFHTACPLQEKKPKKKYKFTKEIRSKVKEKRRLRREKSMATASSDWITVRLKMTEINKIGHDIKKLQKGQRKKELELHCENLGKEQDARKFFQTFKKLADPILNDAPTPLCSTKIVDELGAEAATSQDKANLFANRLQRVHEEPTYEGFDDNFKRTVESYISSNEKFFTVDNSKEYGEEEEGDSSDLLKRVTVDEIKDTLSICKDRSASGMDEISYRVLKKLPNAFLLLLATIFTACFRTGYFPDKWKAAKTILIPKPGKDHKQAKNHRPISLLSCLSKLLERIIAKRLSSHMEKRGLFATSQSGFRAGRMTNEHLLHITEQTFTAFKKKQTSASIFLDAEMAFDKCWHNGIRYKLKNSLNLPDRYVRLLSSFLTDRSLKVFHNGCWSSLVSLRAGTPQGSPLSPLLYLIMVNDIPQSLSNIGKLYQYADDIAMTAIAYTFAAARDKIQKMLNILECWCRKW